MCSLLESEWKEIRKCVFIYWSILSDPTFFLRYLRTKCSVLFCIYLFLSCLQPKVPYFLLKFFSMLRPVIHLKFLMWDLPVIRLLIFCVTLSSLPTSSLVFTSDWKNRSSTSRSWVWYFKHSERLSSKWTLQRLNSSVLSSSYKLIGYNKISLV